jgi:flagellar biosynthesis protein FlhB
VIETYNLDGLGKKIIKWLTILHVVSLPFILVVFWVFSYYIVELWVSHWRDVIDFVSAPDVSYIDKMHLIHGVGGGLTTALGIFIITSLIVIIAATCFLVWYSDKIRGNGA